MSIEKPKTLWTLGLISLVILVGCEAPAPRTQPAEPVATPQITNSATPESPEKPPKSAVVTLPLLDAMLADENFANAIKTELNLSDEELQKVKDAARDDVLQLSEEDTESERSTSAAVTRTEKKITELLGSEKAARFMDRVRGHVASEEGMLATAKPNSVPTDTRVVVNAPAYRMDIFQEGRLITTYKIGIGYPEFPLPSGLRKASSIIFNPTWTPPDEPWVKGKFEPYKKVEAGSKDNPLGIIKIPIGLPSLIHGGKSAARLGTFASHGCVGLTNAQVEDFARQLAGISGTELSGRDIALMLKKKDETKTIDLRDPVPVELRYETMVVEDGTLKIFRDVYEHGTNTEENLRRLFDHYGISFDELDPQLKNSITKGLEQMARDARGGPIDPEPTPQKSSGAVTKSPKGKTMVEFPIPALRGKGYPLPVNLMSR